MSFLRRSHGTAPAPVDSPIERTGVHLYKENEELAKQEAEANTAGVQEHMDTVQEGESERADGHAQASPEGSDVTRVEDEAFNGKVKDPAPEVKPRITCIGTTLTMSQVKDMPGVTMLRERVDIFGQVRPMEPEEELEALNIPARLIGIIKEEPVKRWLTGQELWDKRFHKAGLHAIQQRDHYEKKYAAIIEKARAQGLELVSDHHRPAEYRRPRRVSTMSIESTFSTGEVVPEKRYGPFDIDDERSASSAIVGRRDNVSDYAAHEVHGLILFSGSRLRLSRNAFTTALRRHTRMYQSARRPTRSTPPLTATITR